MGRPVDRAEAGGIDVGVALGGRQAGVAQQFLDGAQIAAGARAARHAAPQKSSRR